MPQFQSYVEDTPVAADKFLFYKGASNVLKTVTLTNLVATIRTLLTSYFTSSTVVPSTAPSAGQVLIGTGTVYAKQTVSGDVTINSSGATTIAAGAVSYAKMQDVSSASKLLGRGASGSGDPQEISLGTGLSMSGTTLNVSAGTGNVSQAADATEADHVFVSGAADKSRVETPVTIDPATGDMEIPGDLDVEGVNTPEIAISAAHSTDGTFHGITVSDVDAGATIAQWETVVPDSAGEWQKADANAAGLFPALGLAVAAGTAGNPLTVLIIGSARNDAWTWTPGGLIYLSTTAGGLTQTAPATSGDALQPVGFARSADVAFFNFGPKFTLVP